MKTIRLLGFYSSLFMAAAAFMPDPAAAAEPALPNIALILANDLGYASLNCYGAPNNHIRTPNWDRLAREGIPADPRQRKIASPQHKEQLYNLTNDPGEKDNLLDKHPDVANNLKGTLAACRNTNPQQNEPATNHAAAPPRRGKKIDANTP